MGYLALVIDGCALTACLVVIRFAVNHVAHEATEPRLAIGLKRETVRSDEDEVKDRVAKLDGQSPEETEL